MVIFSSLEKDNIIPITDILQSEPARTFFVVNSISIKAKTLVKKIISSNFTFKTLSQKSILKRSELYFSLSSLSTSSNSLKKTRNLIEKAMGKKKKI